MKKINRRSWLQLSALGGIATTLSPLESLGKTSQADIIETSSYDYAKLNSNENPFGPSKKVRQAMIDAFDMGCRYPYQRMGELAKMIAKKEGVSRDHIVMAAGSTEGLKAAGLT